MDIRNLLESVRRTAGKRPDKKALKVILKSLEPEVFDKPRPLQFTPFGIGVAGVRFQRRGMRENQMSNMSEIVERLGKVAQTLTEYEAPDAGQHTKDLDQHLLKMGFKAESLKGLEMRDKRRILTGILQHTSAKKVESASYDPKTGMVKFKTVQGKTGEFDLKMIESLDEEGHTVEIGAKTNFQFKSSHGGAEVDPDVVDDPQEMKAVLQRFKDAVARHLKLTALFGPDAQRMRQTAHAAIGEAQEGGTLSEVADEKHIEKALSAMGMLQRIYAKRSDLNAKAAAAALRVAYDAVADVEDENRAKRP